MQATHRPAYSLLAGPPLTVYTHPWFNGRSVFHHSSAFEGRQEVYLGSRGGGLANCIAQTETKSTHISPMYLRTGGPTVNKENVTYIKVKVNVCSYIARYPVHRTAQGALHFIYSIHLRTGGKRCHIYSNHLRTGGSAVDKGSNTYTIHLRTGGPTVDKR